jgi:hypothetical protein
VPNKEEPACAKKPSHAIAPLLDTTTLFKSILLLLFDKKG